MSVLTRAKFQAFTLELLRSVPPGDAGDWFPASALALELQSVALFVRTDRSPVFQVGTVSQVTHLHVLWLYCKKGKIYVYIYIIQ